MNKVLGRTLATMMVLTCGAPPVLCDPPKTAPVPTSSPSSPNILIAPAMVAGFCAGFVVGIPINFVRYLHRETLDGAHALVGSLVKDNNNPILLVPASVASLPAATIVAAMEAPAYAFKNAYMAQKPFSKEQFSLGKLEDPSNE